MEYNDNSELLLISSQDPFFSSSATIESDDLYSPEIKSNTDNVDNHSSPSSSPSSLTSSSTIPSDFLESFPSTPISDCSSSLYTRFSSSLPCSNSSTPPFTDPKEEEELSRMIMSKYLQSINQKLSRPSDRIMDIIKVDFPRDLSIPIFYQLLSQMDTIGAQMFKQCTILKFVSFTEWNNCLFNNNFVSNNFTSNTSNNFSNMNENSYRNKMHLWELMDCINNNGGRNGDYDNNYLEHQHQFENSLLETSTPSSSKYINLEMIGYGSYLSCQSELFSKIFYHISSSIYCPIRTNKYLTRVTIPVPSISTIEPIINWLYTHNDQNWLLTMNENNFEEVCKNVIFLELGDEALKFISNHPLIDNHCHNLLKDYSDDFSLVRCFTEANYNDKIRLKDTVIETLSFKRGIKQLLNLLNINDFVIDDLNSINKLESLIRSRFKFQKLCEIYFNSINIQCLLLDDGISNLVSDELESLDFHSKYVEDIRRIVRIESISEQILNELSSLPSQQQITKTFLEKFNNEISQLCKSNKIIAFKSISAYRTGLNIQLFDIDNNNNNGDSIKVEDSFKEYITNIKNSSLKKLNNKILIDFIINETFKIAIKYDLPIQFHTGFGDNDLDLLLANPLYLRPLIEKFPDVKIVLLHSSYPYTREADGHFLPETYYLATVQTKEILSKVLTEFVDSEYLNVDEALNIIKNILFENSNKLYKLNLTLKLPESTFSPLQVVSAGKHAKLFTDLKSKGVKFVRLGLMDYCNLHRIRLVPIDRFFNDIVNNGLSCAKAIPAFPFFIDDVSTYYLATVQTKEILSKVLTEFVDSEYLNVDEALNIIKNILFENSNKLYKLNLTLKLPESTFSPLQVVSAGKHAKLFTDLKSKGVKFVRLGLMDYCNLHRIRLVPIDRFFNDIVNNGLSCAKAIPAFPFFIDDVSVGSGISVTGEMLLFPDLNTIKQIPYHPSHAHCHVFMKEKDASRSGFPFCTRTLLKNNKNKNGSDVDGNDYRNEPKPIDKTTYCLASSFSGRSATILDEIVESIQNQDILVDQFHSESAFGQFEIVTAPYDPLTTVDKLIVTRQTIYDVAKLNGIRATFLPKPFKDQEFFIAGVISHIKSLCAITLPTKSSYDRITVEHSWAGSWICWGYENREAPIRVCKNSVSGINFEFKFVDATSTPYLAVAAIISAGIDGIVKKLALNTKPISIDPGHLSDQERKSNGIEKLPVSLKESLEFLKQDNVLNKCLGEKIIQCYVANFVIEQQLKLISPQHSSKFGITDKHCAESILFHLLQSGTFTIKWKTFLRMMLK
ncbi:6494_t:CDS:10 [Entrophospora sp. SA101]|nr:6494_t:CDS:10 [Entrophospora sp. SA101]